MTLTDATTPTLSLSVMQLFSDAAILGEISNAYKVALTGVQTSQVAQVVSTVAALDGHWASLASIAVVDTAANVGSLLTALNAQPGVTSIAITSGIGTLQGGTTVGAAALSVTGPGTTVTVAENLNYGGRFNEGAGSTVTNGSGDTLTLSGATTLAGAISGAGALSLTGATTFIGGGGTNVFSSTLINNGAIAVTSGSLDLSGAVTGTGSATIAAGAPLEVDAAVAAGQTFAFGPVGGDLTLDDLNLGGSQLFHGTIANFAMGDTLNVGAPFGTGTTFTFTENAGHTAGSLALTNGATHASLSLTGNFLGADFHTQTSGSATLITYHT